MVDREKRGVLEDGKTPAPLLLAGAALLAVTLACSSVACSDNLDLPGSTTLGTLLQEMAPYEGAGAVRVPDTHLSTSPYSLLVLSQFLFSFFSFFF